VGAGLDRETVARLRLAMFAAIRDTERTAVVEAFRDGGQLLGRSLSEAPAWMSRRLQRAAEIYVASGGRPDAARPDSDGPFAPEEARWVDRAASRVEDRLGRLGDGYLRSLLARFEERWNSDQTLVR
jgi:hypothetical protein